MSQERKISDNDVKTFLRCYNNSEENIRKYEMYGPSNPKWSRSLENGDLKTCPYSEDGICYMLTCKCFNTDNEGVFYEDDYDGECLECEEELPSKQYVWRRPVVSGGFEMGCFCRKCFKPAGEEVDEDDEDDLDNLYDVMIIIRDKHPVIEAVRIDNNIEILSDDTDDYI